MLGEIKYHLVSLNYVAPPVSGFSSPVPPKLAFFSGEGHKNEASYPQWKGEAESVLKTGIYSEVMVITNVRLSLRDRAADVVLAMGSDVTVRQILEKCDVKFGDIFPNDVTLGQFFTARLSHCLAGLLDAGFNLHG